MSNINYEYELDLKHKKYLETLSNSFFVLLGPSGSGKGHLQTKMIKELGYEKIITHTSRNPRENEKHNVDRYFITEKDFENMLKNKEFVEYNLFDSKAGKTYYGTHLEEIKKKCASGKGLCEIDINGAKNYHKYIPNLKSVFILPPSFDEWLKRLENRDGILTEDHKKRLNTGIKEIEEALKLNLPIIVNHTHQEEKTLSLIEKIFQGKEIDEKHLKDCREIAKNILENKHKINNIKFK